MSFLKAKLESSQGVPVHMPANGEEISIERAGGGGFVGGGGGNTAMQQHQRVVGAVTAPSVAAAVVGKKTMKLKSSPPSPLDLDPVSAAGEAVDGGWRPSPAHSALVELVLRPRRGGGFGVGLAAGSDENGESESEGDEGGGSSGDEEMKDAQQQEPEKAQK